MGWTLHMIMCVLLCYPVSIRIYYQQGVLFLADISTNIPNISGIFSVQIFFYFCQEKATNS